MTTPDSPPDISPESADAFHRQMDELYEAMQTPESRAAIDRAFRTPPNEIAKRLQYLAEEQSSQQSDDSE